MAYRNIVFEGGGVLGVAYIGALRELHSRGILDQLRGYAGSSVGSIAAAALACHADLDFVERKLTSLDIQSLKDDSFSYAIDAYNLVRHYGFCKGDKLREWCGDVFRELTGSANITFEQVHRLYGSTLVITGTSLNTLSTRYYSHLTDPDMPIRDAIRISASIPYFFRAIHYENDVLVDGGVLNNYPLSVFDNNAFNTADTHVDLDGGDALKSEQTIDEFIQESVVAAAVDTTTHTKCFVEDPRNRTIGLKLVSNNETHNKWPAVTNIKSFSENLLEAMMLQIAKGHIRRDDWKRTIKINAGDISSVDFDLSDKQKKWLIEQGTGAATEFFADTDTEGKSSSDPVPINEGAAAYGAVYVANHTPTTPSTHHSEQDRLLGDRADKKSKKHRKKKRYTYSH